MTLLFLSLLLLLCIFADRFSRRIGLPALVCFMLLGMFFGAGGPFHIPFNDFLLGEKVCSIALIFIMFYGGFNLKWKSAKPAAVQAVTLSTMGVVITAAVSTLLLHWILKMDWLYAFLISSILGSTDAASVFSILRRNKLNLKNNTAPLLEMESGSNDPISYMLTLAAITLITQGSAGNMGLMIVIQLLVGIAAGFLFAWLTVRFFSIKRLVSSSMSGMALIGMVLLCFAASSELGGNAFLSVYIMGIVCGNSSLHFKSTLLPFFDSLTTMAQVLIFFLLGLLSFPAETITYLPTSLTIFVVLLFLARPIAVFLLSLPFHDSWQKCLLVSFAGLRGAASGVFAAMAVAAGAGAPQSLFQIVFVVTLLSVSIQGALLPWAAHKLDMIDDREDVLRTFNDYVEDSSLSLMRVFVCKTHPWANKAIKEIDFPENSLALMIHRKDLHLACRGDTRVEPGDIVILSVPPYKPDEEESLSERIIGPKDAWCNKTLAELSLDDNIVIVMIKRDGEVLMPTGDTVLLEGDRVAIYEGQLDSADVPKKRPLFG